MALVYVETTIPSFYHETRTDPEIVIRREITRRWWDGSRGGFDLVTSAGVLKELELAPEPKRSAGLDLLAGLPLLPTTERVRAAVEVYVARRVMPANLEGDALHLALASVHGCEYLVTWNCRHLANARKFPHIQRVNSDLGLAIPILATPEQLMEEPHV